MEAAAAVGKHGEKDAIKLSIYNQRRVHITSVAPARWYLYKGRHARWGELQ